jgi:fibro-slime domain-containing protein
MVREWWVACVLAVLVGCSGNHVGPKDDERSDGGDEAADGGGDNASTGNSNGADAASDQTDAGLSPCDGGQSEGCIVTEPEPACGDGELNVVGEQCDDGNDVSDDGCTATCMRDPDYACPVPGQRCINTVHCGDSKISGSETCDDGDADAGDGCDASCNVEPGYTCPIAGFTCRAAQCGDGIVASDEECDFTTSVTGCSNCRIDSGFDCNATSCAATVCGNSALERGEQCDDGLGDEPFDGCFACKSEPRCANGVCTAVCGDGQRFADEQCDDGNSRSGDGCSSDCHTETGFACVDLAGTPPSSVTLPMLFRDFIGKDRGKYATDCDDPVTVPNTTKPCYHIDFNRLGGSIRANVLESELDVDGRPVYSCPSGNCDNNPGHVANSGRFTFNGKAAFNQWYDSSAPLAFPVVDSVSLSRDSGTGVYVFDSASAGGFYPLNGKGWIAAGKETSTKDCADKPGRNVSFTSETHFWFEYQGGERFEFVGDDDLWVFVNRKILVDLGGLHGANTARFALGPIDDGDNGSVEVPLGSARVQNEANGTLNSLTDVRALGLELGGVYEVSMFHAERNECGSNFKVTLKDFNRPKSSCASECGDGVVASDELCDNGSANADPAPYAGCGLDCRTRGNYCGDGQVDTNDGEACDDGANLSVYAQSAGDCAPNCKSPAFCGDGVVQSLFGERCDDGTNDGSYGKCAPGCVLGPRCGDGVVQKDADEDCDDGNLTNYDSCNVNCKSEVVL